MPIIIYSAIFVLFICSFRINKGDYFLDKQSSTVLKGFFILMIVISHILNEFPYSGLFSWQIGFARGLLGQLVVSMFFFISGYGIIVSIERKGTIYQKTILTNRFIRIFMYGCVSVIPFIIYSLCMQIKHPIEDYFLVFIGIKSFGNASWFLFAILVCYLSCSIFFAFNFKNRYIAPSLVSASILLYVIIMYLFKAPYYKWDTIICFIFGMFISLARKKLNSFFNKSKFLPYFAMAFSFVLVVVIRYFNYCKYNYFFPLLLEMWFTNFFFCFFFVALTKVFSFKSSILTFLGNASFSIFIMHYLPIRCFLNFGLIQNENLNYILVFSLRLAVGIPFHYLYKLIDKFITNPIVEYNKSLINCNANGKEN